jgi:hypothetical protein
MSRRLAALIAGMILMIASSGSAQAQNSAVQSVTITDLGNIVAAPTGATTFRIDPATGSVTRISGQGVRLATAPSRSLVTIFCGNQPACANADTLMTVSSTGTPTGRAGALTNFTASTAGTTTSITSTLTTGNTLTFTIGAFGRKASTDVWIGFDMPISGNEATSSTGAASAGFVVSTAKVSNGNITSAMGGQATASVFRALTISNTAGLSFGRISRPSSGSGTVSLAPTTGAVNVTGAGVTRLSAGSNSAAAFAIAGEGGQSISITVPPTFTLTGTSGTITVTTNPTLSGAQILSGSLGTAGSLPLRVGGTFGLTSSTPAQAYTGTLAVTVQYN